jgi:hypothetical protein
MGMSELEKDGGLHASDLRAEKNTLLGLADAIELLRGVPKHLGTADEWALRVVLDAAGKWLELHGGRR